MSVCLTIARKELRDHARDVRSVVTAAGMLLMGPAIIAIVSRSPVVTRGRGAGVTLAMASVFALVAALSGAMNLAMDATAGERERRSLVPLRLCPVSPLALAIGKWLAASVFALGGLVLTMVALAIVLGADVIGVMIKMLAVLAPLALLSAAAHLLLAARCRSTKEAHTWLSTLVFAPMTISMLIVFFPGTLDGWPSLLPVVAQQQLMAQAIAGTPWSIGAVLAPTAMTLAAVLPALHLAGRALGRDDVHAG